MDRSDPGSPGDHTPAAPPSLISATPSAPWFSLRPLCPAAAGAILGVLLCVLIKPPNAYLFALCPLAGAVFAAFVNRRGLFLLCLAVALFLLWAGMRYPAAGIPKSGPVIQLPAGALTRWVEDARAAMEGRIALLFPENPGVAAGMLLGDKAGVGDDILSDFQDAGVLHLMAVSGLHVSVLAGAFSLLFRRSGWARLVGCTLFCAVYAALTGFSPSVLRASLMLFALLLAFPLGRRPDGPSTLAFALLGVLVIQPFALLRASFQLSFGAAYGLIAIESILYRPIRRLGPALGHVLAGSAAVLIATVPAMALFFRELSFLSLLANVIVLPLAPFFLIPGFLAAALSFLLPAVARLAALPARLALNAMVAVVGYTARWTIRIPSPNGISYLLYLLALAVFSRYCKLEPGKKGLAGCVLLLLSLSLWLAGWKN